MKETYVGGDIIETTGGNNLSYAKGNIENSGEQVIQNGKTNGVAYGTNKKWEGPAEIVSLKWLDENGKPLAKKTINTIEYDAFLYGEKVKAEITFSKNITQEVEIKVKSYFSTKFEENFKIKPQGAKVTTPLFIIPLDVYDDSEEKYQYSEDSAGKSHYTYYEKELIEHFTVSVVSEVGAKFFDDKKDTLKPYTYFRNYEELIGLFKEAGNGDKDAEHNYENKYIKDNAEIKTIVDRFVAEIKNGKLPDVATAAKALWDNAVKQVRGGQLDDRPLYWARNKMQTWLKRLPEFKDDIDYEKSIVKKGKQLASIIQTFEEKSRNYTGIDFSKAGGKKKVLITGFDPFILNQFDNPKYIGNILQSNPSGIIALALANNSRLGANIQTMVVPVRYTDFDGSQENDKGQGDGIIEKYIRPFINEVNMIITVSQAGIGDYHIDVFATLTREGFNDNMDFTRKDESKSVSNSAPETIVTTLPIQMTQGNSKAIYWGKYRQKDGTTGNATINNYPKEEVYNGPGGNYLSNEIFYRVAKLRSELNSTLKSGHFHISMIQPSGDLKAKAAKELLDIVKQALMNGFKVL